MAMTYSCKCTQVISKVIGFVNANFGWRLGFKCESRVFLALGGIVNVNVWYFLTTWYINM